MTGWKRVVALSAVAGAAAISAGAASAWVSAADTARTAIEASLAARGIDPDTVVWQEGARNYAGPNCPGRGWNCTRARVVVQFSTSAAQNVAECTDGTVTTTPTSDGCVISQTGGTNQARCKMSRGTVPLAEQTCEIMQTGTRNTARVEQTINQTSSPSQEARQRAVITQTATDRNEVQVKQTAKQKTNAAAAQSQDAFQVVEITQTATGSNNLSNVAQSQEQEETGDAPTQAQNTNAAGTPTGFDCGSDKPTEPNQCARVEQEITSGDGGKNESRLNQTIKERQTSKSSFPTQDQGSFDGGQEGEVHQVNAFDAGRNLDVANQKLDQGQSAKDGASQTQLTDPNCCGFSQVGGEENEEDINQRVTQKASEDDAFQFAELTGQAAQESFAPAAVATFAASDDEEEGECSIEHFGRNNSGTEQFEVDKSPCPFLRIETTCTSGGEVSTAENGGPCTTIRFDDPPSESEAAAFERGAAADGRAARPVARTRRLAAAA